MQQWIDEQFQPWVGVNENFETIGHQAVYGKRQPVTAGLTWGYYGGRWGDFAITEGTVTLTASATNHLVVAWATGVLSTATASTNWDNTADYARVYKITTGTGSVTGVEDHRLATAGVHVSTSTTTVATTSWKQAVRAASTANGTLATAFENGDTLDGVTLATGDRILLKNQSAVAENGIYTVNASGAPTRATDADAGSELVNATVFVSEGTANADTQWTCTTNAPITVGSTALVFAQGGGGGSGTVTSVAASVPTFLSVAGSPVTTSGTLAITLSGTALPVANGGTGGTSASAARTALSAATTSQADEMISGFIGTVTDKTYKLVVKASHGGTITEATTVSESGTCTATWKINTTALGGTANSVSTSETSQAHASANAFSAGDDIQLTVSSNATCLGLSFTLKYTRVLA